MNFNRNQNKPVAALLGAGSMGTAIVRRIAANKTVILGDISEKNLEKAAQELRTSGYDVHTCKVDATDRKSVEEFAGHAQELGPVMYYIHTAGASPNQASPEHIVTLDLIGTAYAIDAFGKVIARGGAGLVVSSQAGYMMKLPTEVETLLSNTPTERLADLNYVKKEAHANSGVAYIVSKRCNHLRVRNAAATVWGDRGARINSISPGVIVTPLAYDEFNANGEGYQMMIDASPAKRVGTSDEVAGIGAFLLSDSASFITGIDLLADGGVIAAIESGKYQIHMK